MQIIAGQNAPPHFFLLGLRAPPNGAVGTDGPAEKVGVAISRAVLSFDGSLAPDQGQVSPQDEPPAAPPFRFESEIAACKDELDVIVVDNTPPALPLATVTISRGGGPGVATQLGYGWASRTDDPRLSLAGADLANFPPASTTLPTGFRNSFWNGRPGNSLGQPLRAGDALYFTPLTMAAPVLPDPLTIPPEPAFSLTDTAGDPFDPPVTLTPRMDTLVVNCQTATPAVPTPPAPTIVLLWRASFLWEDRFEAAVLRID